MHGGPVHLGASIGVWLAAAGETADDCLRHGDEAMYVVKRARASS
jgi:GGDEF domain-containing protein